MSSTGVRRERSTDSRLSDSMLAEDRAQIESEKVFKEFGDSGASTSAGVSNNPTGAGNSLAKTGDTKSGPFGNEFIEVEIINDAIDASITGPNYFPYLILKGEGGADDDLNDIYPGSNPVPNRELTLEAKDNTITIKQNLSVDNPILTPNGADIIMVTGDLVFMVYNLTLTAWIVTGQSDVAAAAKLDELGDLNSGFVVNYNIYDDRQLYANQVSGAPSAVALTFINIPPNLSTNLKIYLKDVTATNSLTIGGTLIYDSGNDPFNIKPFAVNDFLAIEYESPDQANITVISVKKNDEDVSGDVIPGVPTDVEATDLQQTSIKIIWNPPDTGTLKVLYDIAWSTSPVGDATNGPTSPAPGSPITGIDALEQQVTGLIVSTTYYFWVRGTNVVGNGNYFGGLQTSTEPSDIPGDVNYAIAPVDFRTVQASWVQPAGKQLQFSLIRDPGGSDERLLASRVTTSETIIDDRLEPVTSYPYTFQVFNEVGTLLSTVNSNELTPDLPLPVLTLGVVGRKLQFSIPIISGINIAQVQWDLVDTFDFRPADLQMIKTSAKDVQQTVVVQTQELNAATTYFVRARFKLNENNGAYNATQDDTTGTLAVPAQPDINIFGIGGDNNGLIKFEIEYDDNISLGETGYITVRDSASVGAYTTYPGFALARDNPPVDDLDPLDEDEVRVVRGGGGWGASGTIIVVSGAVTGFDITFGGSDYTNNEEIRIYDDNDSNYTGFRGRAVVNGFGQLTGINIDAGGDFYDNGAQVLFVGFVDDSLWFSGNQLNFRAVCTNASGESPADTAANPTVG